MSALAVYRGLLRNPRLTRLLAGEFISSIGDWLYLVALLIVVYRADTDPVLLGIVGAARVLPYVVLSVPAGVVADRFDRRLVLMVTDVARGAIMLALAALVWVDGPLWAIVALSILATCFSTFFGPTIGSFLPSLVRDEAELGPANSAWSSLDNLAYVIGPAIGGLLIAASNLAIAFLLNAVSFGVVTVILWRLPSAAEVAAGAAGGEVAAAAAGGDVAAAALAPSGADPGGDHAGHGQQAAVDGAGETAEAPRAVAPGAFEARAVAPGAPQAGASDTNARGAGAPAAPNGQGTPGSFRSILRPVAALALVDVVGSFVFGGLSILTVVLATTSFGTGDEATGYLNAALGVGGVLGAIGSGALVLRPRLAPALLVGALGLGLGVAVLGAVSALALALIAISVAAAGELVVEVVSTTIFQRVVPDAVRGRAIGGVASLSTLAFAAGSLALPILAGGIGTGATLLGSGVAIVAATVVAVALLGSTADRPEDAMTVSLRRVARLPVFAGVAPARLEIALRDLTRLEVASGEVVIRQGDRADRFYIIESGRFEVTQRASGAATEQRVLRNMGPDEVFGEIGLLTAAPRTATVTAVTAGTLLVMSGPAFLELVGTGPGLATRLLDLHRGASVPRGAGEATAGLSGT